MRAQDSPRPSRIRRGPRRRLWTGAPLLLALACSDSGGDGRGTPTGPGPTPPPQTDSRRLVILDPAIPGAKAALQLTAGIHSAEVVDDSTGRFEQDSVLPQLVLLTRGDEAVRMAIAFGNRDAPLRLNRESTAQAMAFLTPGITTTDTANVAEVLQRIRQAPTFGALAAELAGGGAGSALNLDAPAVREKLAAVVGEVLAQEGGSQELASGEAQLAWNDSYTVADQHPSGDYSAAPGQRLRGIQVVIRRSASGASEAVVTNHGYRWLAVVGEYEDGRAGFQLGPSNGSPLLPNYLIGHKNLREHLTDLLPIPPGWKADPEQVVVPLERGHAFAQLSIFGIGSSGLVTALEDPGSSYLVGPAAYQVMFDFLLPTLETVFSIQLRRHRTPASEAFVRAVIGEMGGETMFKNIISEARGETLHLLQDVMWAVLRAVRSNSGVLYTWAVESGTKKVTTEALASVARKVNVANKLYEVAQGAVTAYDIVKSPWVYQVQLACITCGQGQPSGSVAGVVRCNGTPASGITVWAGGRTATTGSGGGYTIPGVPAGTARVAVEPQRQKQCAFPAARMLAVPAGGPASAGFDGESVPAITGVSPNPAPLGGTPQTLVVRGSGFRTGAALRIDLGAQTLTPATTFVNGGELRALVSPGRMGTSGSVTVRNPLLSTSSDPHPFRVGDPVTCSGNEGASLHAEDPQDRDVLAPGAPFTKLWTLRNTGTCTWPAGLVLRHHSSGGAQLAVDPSPRPVGRTVRPGESVELRVEMKAPAAAGEYREDWRLADAQGRTVRVGGSATVWALIRVPSTGEFGLQVAPASRTGAQGQGATYTVTVSSNGGFAGAVQLFALNLPGNRVLPGTGFTPQTVNVPAGGAASSVLTIRTDGDTPPGTYTTTVSARSGGMVREQQVELGVTAAAPPDLTAAATVAATYVPGQAGVQVPVTVRRSGGPVVRGNYVQASLYFSTDSRLDAADALLWESSRTAPDYPNEVLNAQGARTVNASVAIPDVPAGTYYLLAVANSDDYHAESNAFNNVAAYPARVERPAPPDLTAAATVAATYAQGESGVRVPVTVRRSGGPLTRGTYVTAALYFSADNRLDAGDTRMWESNGSTPDYPNSALNDQGSRTVTATVGFPPVAAGTYHVLAAVNTDGFHTESSTANNVAAYAVTLAAPLPDLTAQASVAGSYTSGQGGVQVPFTLRRTGGPLTRGTYASGALYLSTNAQWDAGDTRLWESNGSTPDFPLSVLNSQGSRTVTATVGIPSVAAGTYYLLAVANHDSWHTESSTSNNVAAHQVSVLPGCVAGAGFGSKSHPDNTQVGRGAAFTMQWTAQNTGTCTWNSRYGLRYGSHTRQQLSTSQAAQPVGSAVAPGSTWTFSVPMRAPTVPGTYRETWVMHDDQGRALQEFWVQIVVP